MWPAESHIRDETWDSGLSHATFNPLEQANFVQQESLLLVKPFFLLFSLSVSLFWREHALATRGRVYKPEPSL